MTGVAPDTADFGLISSVGLYVSPQLSQLSPYWSSDLHLGQVPFTKRSGR
ncbi:hypothetical protein VCHENC02_1876A, partial [Vibrio harveyi]